MRPPTRAERGTLSRLYVICDADVCDRAGWTIVDFAAACLEGGARLLQVRAKSASSGRFLEMASTIVTLAQPAGAMVLVNDRADIARLSGAAGVHVGQDDLSPRDARSVIGTPGIVGLSTHTERQIDAAAAENVSYVAVGPVYGTATKATGYDAIGVGRVRYAAAAMSALARPIVAIGGITLDRVADVINAGAASVAVITDLLATGDPVRRVREYLDRLV